MTKQIKKILLAVLLTSILLFLTVIILFLFFKKEPVVSVLPENKTPQKEAPKITLPKILYNLAGPVQNFDKISITFEASIPQLDEKGEAITKIEIRKALITPTTKFIRLTFVAQPETDRQTPLEISITFQDIKIGDYIEVISNQDISQKEEFEATLIRILPR